MELPEEDATALAKRSAIRALMRDSSLSPSERSVRMQSIMRGEGITLARPPMIEGVVADDDDDGSAGGDDESGVPPPSSSSSSSCGSSATGSEYSEDGDEGRGDDGEDDDDIAAATTTTTTTLLPPTPSSPSRTKAPQGEDSMRTKCISMADDDDDDDDRGLSVRHDIIASSGSNDDDNNNIVIDNLIRRLTSASPPPTNDEAMMAEGGGGGEILTNIDLPELKLTDDEILPLLELLLLPCNDDNNNTANNKSNSGHTTNDNNHNNTPPPPTTTTTTTNVSAAVTILNLRRNHLGPFGMYALSSVIRYNTHLRSIDIGGNNICAESCAMLSRCLTYNTSLRILILEDNDIGDDGAVALAEAFERRMCTSTEAGGSTSPSSGGCRLRVINLNNNHIGDDGACALFRALGGTTATAAATASTTTSAAAASITGSTIDSSCSSGSSSSTENFPAITTLYLKFNLISDGGATELASALLDNEILHTIDLSNNRITNIGAVDILNVLEINDTLEILYLDGNLDIDDKLLLDIQYAIESTNDSASEDYASEDYNVEEDDDDDDDDDENDTRCIDENENCEMKMSETASSSYADEERSNNSLMERIAAKLRSEEMKVGQTTWRQEDNTVCGLEHYVSRTTTVAPSIKTKMKNSVKGKVDNEDALVTSAHTTTAGNPSTLEVTGANAMIADMHNDSNNVIAKRRAIHTVVQDRSLDGVEDIMAGRVELPIVNSEGIEVAMITVVDKDEDESNSNDCDIDIETCRTMSASASSTHTIPDDLVLPPTANSTPVIRNGSRGDSTGRHESLSNNTAAPLNDIYTRQKSNGNNGMRTTIADQWKQCMMAPHFRSHDNLLDLILAHQYRLSLTMPSRQSYFRVVALVFFSRILDGIIQSERNYVVGTNDEPHSISGSICAERAALMQLRFVPDLHEITKVVIVTDEVETISPGMLCREFMASHNRIPWVVPIILGRSVCKITGYDISGKACGDDIDRCFDRTKNDTLRNVDKEIWADVGNNKDYFTPRDFFGVQVTLKDLFPHPSLYSRLSANEAVRFGEDCVRRNVVTDPLLRKKSSWKHSSNRSNRWSDDDTVRTHRQDEFDVSLLSGIFDEKEEETEDEIGNIRRHISNGKSSNATASQHSKLVSLKSDLEESDLKFMLHHLTSRTVRMSKCLRPSQRREKLIRLATEVTTLEIAPQKHIHPIRYGAAVLFNDGTVILASQKVALEYGCSLDAVGQLASAIDRKANIILKDGHPCRPMMLVQCDQFGIAHPPFAQGRAYLSERGYGDCKILVHQLKKGINQIEGEISNGQIINNDENARGCDIGLRLIEVDARDLAPAPPDIFGQSITKNH